MNPNPLPNQSAPTEASTSQPVKDVQVSNKPSKNKGLSLKLLLVS